MDALIGSVSPIAIVGAAAFLLMLVLTPAVIRLAHRMGWLAHPKQDRWHDRPTALMGGIAIYAAAVTAYFVVMPSLDDWPIWAGATIMFLTGFVDDRRHIKPATKLMAQVLAAALLIAGGYAMGSQWPIWVFVPVTFLWVIGITNSLNLLDNMDGLAAGIAGIAALILAGFSMLSGGGTGLAAAVATAGAALGFLVFNFKPARIFMGDSGSLFLGYMIAALAIAVQSGSSAPHGLAVYVVSAAVLAVPIFDTTLVTLVRPLAGRAVSQGGRDHSSHRLVFLGLSERRAVLVLYAISLLFGGLALAFHIAEAQLFYALVLFSAVALATFGVFLGGIDVYGREQQPVSVEPSGTLSRVVSVLNGIVGTGWRSVFGMVADLLLVIAAFICAYHLRFEKGIAPHQAEMILTALPIIVGIKLPVFYMLGLYRGIWRYAGTPELVRIVKATLLSTAAMFVGLGLMFGFGGLSKGVIVIDWMIVTIAIVAVRFSFRAIPKYISAQRRSGRRVLMYGAGSVGVLALNELRQNPRLEYLPIGFVDDDASKHGLLIQGISVLGPSSEIERFCLEKNIQVVLITMSAMPTDKVADVYTMCDRLGISCRALSVRIDAPDLALRIHDELAEVARIAPGM